MEYFNRQMSPGKTGADLLTKGANLVVIALLLAGLLCSCSVLPDRYLFPTVPSREFAGQDGKIIFQKLTEDFLATGQIGVHQVGNRQQKLKTMTGEVATALQTLIANQLADHNLVVQLADEKLWNLTVGDLDRLTGKSIVFGGQIRQLSVVASTLTARVATEYEFFTEIDCYIGRVEEKKVVKRTVRFSHKMLSFLHTQKEMDKLLDKFLAEAAVQVVENIESFLQ
jgi:hypothetical protein